MSGARAGAGRRRNSRHGLRTRAIHAGEGPDPATGASAPPIHLSSTFVAEEIAGFSAHELGEESPWLYTRWANPTLAGLEAKLAALENTEDCLCLASGMAAASAIFLTFLSAGDHVVVSDVSYAGVAELVRDTLPRMGMDVASPTFRARSGWRMRCAPKPVSFTARPRPTRSCD